MPGENVNLTAAEWNVMELLWEKAPQTAMQLAAQLHDRVGWAKSTTMTMLSRMEKKDLLTCFGPEKPRRYATAIRSFTLPGGRRKVLCSGYTAAASA